MKREAFARHQAQTKPGRLVCDCAGDIMSPCKGRVDTTTLRENGYVIYEYTLCAHHYNIEHQYDDQGDYLQ